jgi:hypothetical protein
MQDTRWPSVTVTWVCYQTVGARKWNIPSVCLCKRKTCRIQTDSRDSVLSSHTKVFASTEIRRQGRSACCFQTGTHLYIVVPAMGRLKGIPAILQPDLLHALSSMGHGDEIGECRYISFIPEHTYQEVPCTFTVFEAKASGRSGT